jgi:hypothetical protein
MSQAWLQVSGLVLDMVGVLLIAGEWLLAQRQDARAEAIDQSRHRSESQLERFRRMTPNADPRMLEHMERVDAMQRDRSRASLAETRREFGRRRLGTIYAGLVFVVTGFALQVLGAWPGCCLWLGILPSAQ